MLAGVPARAWNGLQRFEAGERPRLGNLTKQFVHLPLAFYFIYLWHLVRELNDVCVVFEQCTGIYNTVFFVMVHPVIDDIFFSKKIDKY